MGDTRTYCSQTQTHEPLAGTADVVDAWLMVEYRGVWQAKAYQASALGPRTKEGLQRIADQLAARKLRARVQLIRRPELEAAATQVLVGLRDRLLTFSGSGYDVVDQIDVATICAEPDQPATGGPIYFVCTNGQRDLCCARYGLPVYQLLRERVGDRVWQTTHLGGHRFAPNVLVLPGGFLYGRVTPDSVDAFVEQVEGGSIPFQHLRGRSCLPPHVQAAEAFAGEQGLEVVSVSGDELACRVTFARSGGRVDVSVRRSTEPLDVQKSCGEDPGPVFPYYRA